MIKYDYLVVGAGLFGSVFAYNMHKAGKRCLIVEKRNHIAGNVYTENQEGIDVHLYGAHIFHTSDKSIWEFVNQHAEFNRFTNAPLAYNKGKYYNLPFNMNTFYQLWGTARPEDAKKKIEEQVQEYSHITEPKNLEEQALKLAGRDIYETLIKGYTEKQWGRPANEIPAFIIKRLPFRYTYDNNYFNDTYQGIPIKGYAELVNSLLSGIDVRCNVDYLKSKNELDKTAKRILYTGKIDEFYNYKYGKLEYRSLKFENSLIDTENYQGNAVINYTEREVPFTRIIEHKHFNQVETDVTIITKEYSSEYDGTNEAYYPINDAKNQEIYNKYRNISKSNKGLIFGGRLGEYKYYDMHQVIAEAFDLSKKELENA